MLVSDAGKSNQDFKCYFAVLGIFKLELVLPYIGTGVPPHTHCASGRKMKAVLLFSDKSDDVSFPTSCFGVWF